MTTYRVTGQLVVTRTYYFTELVDDPDGELNEDSAIMMVCETIGCDSEEELQQRWTPVVEHEIVEVECEANLD